jgi:hypothetical protein
MLQRETDAQHQRIGQLEASLRALDHERLVSALEGGEKGSPQGA